MAQAIFEAGTRAKLRFATTKGSVSIEELWDLPLTSTVGAPNLDDIARGLHKAVKDSEEISFVEKPAQKNKSAELALDIVKRVIEVRIEERDAAKLAAEKKAEKQRIMELIVSKKDEALAGKSLEELQKMMDEL